MPSTYSPRLRLEQPATGEQAGTWGVTLNANAIAFMEEAICGASSINVTAAGDYTLSVSVPGGSADEARRAMLLVSGTPNGARNVIIPQVQKTYIVDNQTTQTVTVKTAAAGGWAVSPGTTTFVYCDGTNVRPVGIGYRAAGAIAIPAIAVAGAGSFAGALSATAGTTLSAPGATSPATVIANTGAVAFDLRGRSADNNSVIRFLNDPGSTEYARIQGGPSGLALQTQDGVTLRTALSFTLPGVASFLTGVSVGGALSVAGASTVTGLTSQGDITTHRSSAQGYLFLGNTGARFIGWDGTNYTLGGAGGGTIWTTGNFNPANYLALATGGDVNGRVASLTGRMMSQVAGQGAVFYCHVPGIGAAGMLLDASARIQIATTDALGNYSSTRAFFDHLGGFVATGNVSAYSDARLKRDIQPLEYESTDELVQGLAHACARFRWREGEGRDHLTPQMGVIAQGVQRVLPEAVGTTTEGHLHVSDRPMVAALLVTVARLLDRVATLEARDVHAV